MVAKTQPVETSVMMMRKPRWRACECVTPGHPDKVCDQISDAILDAALAQDKRSRVAIETHGGHGIITINGEMTTTAILDLGEIARTTYRGIGHHDHSLGVIVNVVKQSPNINALVSANAQREQGAGDQGIMVGFATDETTEMMPLPWVLARRLCDRLVEARTSCLLPWLRPDGKSQVVLEGNQIRHVTIAAHYQEGTPLADLREQLLSCVVRYVFPDCQLDPERDLVINGGGEFCCGGFDADAGTTGRKIVVDQFGPDVPVGGGAFSGKDPSKVDRSAAYMCRFVAKSIVASGIARQALVKVAYAIGNAQAFMLSVSTDLPVEEEKLEHMIRKKFDFRPAAIIERFGLLERKGWRYQETAAYGHYGNNKFPWEQVTAI